MQAPGAGTVGRSLESAVSTAVLCLAGFAVPLVFLRQSTESTLPKLIVLVLCAGLLCMAMGTAAIRGKLALPSASQPLLASLVGVSALTAVRTALEPPSTTGIERILTLASGIAIFASVQWLLPGCERRRNLLFAAVLAGGYAAM
ncbi:MAG TPA: hypothetical protein P5266_06305, partial [Candidatus Fermentibacter sp.]|nr:hypothetical protein [Candidatus Fermentibacter sp.]